MSTVTSDDHKALEDLSNELSNARRQMYQTQSQVINTQKSQKKNELTLSEVTSLPEDVTTYQAVGRMFMKKPLQDITKGLNDSIAGNKKDIQYLQAQHQYYSNKVEKLTHDINELSKQSKSG